MIFINGENELKTELKVIKSDTTSIKAVTTLTYESQFPTGFIGSAPRARQKIAAIQVTGISNNNNIVADGITYIFVTTLGTPGANTVHIKIQGTIAASCKKFVDATYGRIDIANITYGSGVGANTIFQTGFTTSKLNSSVNGLTAGNNIYLQQYVLDSAAATLTSTTTRSLISPFRPFHYRYNFELNSTSAPSGLQYMYINTSDTKQLVIVNINVMTVSANTDKQMDILISNDEITYTVIYSGLDISNVGTYQLPEYKVPPGYTVYCQCSSSGTNNNEYVDFSIIGKLI